MYIPFRIVAKPGQAKTVPHNDFGRRDLLTIAEDGSDATGPADEPEVKTLVDYGGTVLLPCTAGGPPPPAGRLCTLPPVPEDDGCDPDAPPDGQPLECLEEGIDPPSEPVGPEPTEPPTIIVGSAVPEPTEAGGTTATQP